MRRYLLDIFSFFYYIDMKTLNDYIRESLLDDEEELINKSIKDSQDPLKVLVSICKERNNEDKILKKLDNGLFDDFLRDVISIDMNDIKGSGVIWKVEDHDSDNYNGIQTGDFVDMTLIIDKVGSKIFKMSYIRKRNELSIEIPKLDRMRGHVLNLLQSTNYVKKYRSTLIKLSKLGFKKYTGVLSHGLYKDVVVYEKNL